VQELQRPLPKGVKVAGGIQGAARCVLQVFWEQGCPSDKKYTSGIGPINNPNLGGCLHSFPFQGPNGIEFWPGGPMASFRLTDCA
jgi:hypothetical protein